MKNQNAAARKIKKAPLPPGSEASDDEIIAYHSRYSLDELEKAGLAEEPGPEEVRELSASANYAWLIRNGLRLKLSARDYEQVSLLAAKEDVAVESLVKKWVRDRLRHELKSGKGPTKRVIQ